MTAKVRLPRLALMLPGALALLSPPPARAQVVASLTLSSDVRFRGRSVTDMAPAATVDLGYDDQSGIYVAANATAGFFATAPELVNFQENLGFAHRLGSGPTIDLGIVHSNYTEHYSGGENAHFTEVYAGLLTNHLTVYLHYSPDYFRPGVETLYGEVNAVIEPVPQWRLNAHVGALMQVAGPYPPDEARTGYDWKLGLTREMGHFELQVAVSGGGADPQSQYSEGQRQDRTAVTVSLTWNL